MPNDLESKLRNGFEEAYKKEVQNKLSEDDKKCIEEWKKCYKALGLEDSSGQSCNYFAFFCHGWNARNKEGFWQ